MKSAQNIYERLKANFVALAADITDFNVGSVIRSLLEAIALGLENLWFYADRIYQACFVATARGDDLDLRAAELGITRKQAAKARGWVRFTGDNGTVIPAGTIVSTSPSVDPVAEFKTTQDVTITGGSVSAPVEALAAGRSGNVAQGKITYVPQTIPGVNSVTNPVATAGGADTETDEELRSRCVRQWSSTAAGATAEYFRAKALEVEGVAEAQVIGCHPEPGCVLIRVWSRDEEGRLVPGSPQLIEDVQEYLNRDDVRPVCIRVAVEAPSGVPVDVDVWVSALGGYEWTDVAQAVRGQILGYFETLGPGDDVLVSRLIDVVMEAEGVYDAVVMKPRTNISIADADTAIAGEIKVLPFSEFDPAPEPKNPFREVA